MHLSYIRKGMIKMKKILITCMTCLLCFLMLTGCGKSKPKEQSSEQKSVLHIQDQNKSTDSELTNDSDDAKLKNQRKDDEDIKQKSVDNDISNNAVSTDNINDESYFDDAVFIGNSRTEGLRLYGGLDNAKFLAHTGLMVDTVFTSKYFDGEKTAMQALPEMNFSKVYLMLGINELGWSYPQIFKKDYGLIIDEIKKINPDAIIFIQSILPVTMEKSATDAIYNMDKINNFNSLLVELSEEKNVIYLDVSEEVSDENGFLPSDGTSDGIHFNADYCKKWVNYLMKNKVQ